MSSCRSLSRRGYKPNMSLISLGILVVLLTLGTNAQDFVLPDNNIKVTQRNQDMTLQSRSSIDVSRKPVPSKKCGDNMILDEVNSSTSSCVCSLGYLYYPDHDKCYWPYKRGPCDKGHHLVLPANRTIAKCTPNPCITDNLVFYNGSCHSLLSQGPCPPNWYFDISVTTFEPTCERIQVGDRFFIAGRLTTTDCPPGMRRTQQGSCRRLRLSK